MRSHLTIDSCNLRQTMLLSPTDHESTWWRPRYRV
uniref:Uncharacterized protein n=1 Tax=Arundo donax TaxID=35708 RepID=A0A0A9HVX2_ARUDO